MEAMQNEFLAAIEKIKPSESYHAIRLIVEDIRRTAKQVVAKQERWHRRPDSYVIGGLIVKNLLEKELKRQNKQNLDRLCQKSKSGL